MGIQGGEKKTGQLTPGQFIHSCGRTFKAEKSPMKAIGDPWTLRDEWKVLDDDGI
jgi:hypothetical protein